MEKLHKVTLITGGIIVIALLAFMGLNAVIPEAEPVDLSENIGYLSFDPELSYIPPMPDGYITRDEIKDAILETFIITDTSVLDLTKPYYKPFNANAYYSVVYGNQVDKVPYSYPFFSCDDYSTSVFGDFNDNPEYANMPVFWAHVKYPDGHPHAVLITYYNDDIWYIETTCYDYAGIAPHDTYELVLIVG